MRAALLFTVLLAAVPACRSLERDALVGERSGVTAIPGFVGVRASNGFPSAAFQASFTRGLVDRAEHRRALQGTAADAGTAPPSYQVLVLGAGGPNGAFGAGLLAGWTESGERPRFDLVTGVSAGAVLAPFAFAGSEHDRTLQLVFERLHPRDMYVKRGTIAPFFGESLMDPEPLWESIVGHVDMDLLEEIARGHEEGRRLYVGTTNLDAGAFVVWDLGAIAVRRDRRALRLFRQVILASAAIPVFYPPVLFEVRGPDGERGDEMHVDGSIASPMFLPHQVFDTQRAVEEAGLGSLGAQPVVTVVHNGALTPPAEAVRRRTADIAARSFLMASAAMVQEDVVQLYLLSRVWGAQFRFVAIPEGDDVSVLGFTPDDTARIYAQGRALGRTPWTWPQSPPGYLVADELRDLPPVLSVPEPDVDLRR